MNSRYRDTDLPLLTYIVQLTFMNWEQSKSRKYLKTGVLSDKFTEFWTYTVASVEKVNAYANI